MKLAAMVLAAGVFVGGAAQAQSLYMVGMTDTGMVVAERDSIQWRDGRPRLKVHQIYNTPLAFEKTYGSGYDWVQRSVAEYEIDCQILQSRTLSFRFFTFDGLQSGGNGEVSEWTKFTPGSLMQDVRGLACENILPSDTHFESLSYGAYILYDVLNNPDDE